MADQHQLDRRIKILVFVKVALQLIAIIIIIIWLVLITSPENICIRKQLLDPDSDACHLVHFMFNGTCDVTTACFKFDSEHLFKTKYFISFSISIGFLLVSIFSITGYFVSVTLGWTIICPLLDFLNTLLSVILLSTSFGNLQQLENDGFVKPDTLVKAMNSGFIATFLLVVQTIISYVYIVHMQIWAQMMDEESESSNQSRPTSSFNSKMTSSSNNEPSSNNVELVPILKKPVAPAPDSSPAGVAGSTEGPKPKDVPVGHSQQNNPKPGEIEEIQHDHSEMQNSHVSDFFSFSTMIPHTKTAKYTNVYAPLSMIRHKYSTNKSSLDNSAPENSLTIQTINSINV